jgi:hypothetical protein
VAAAGPPDVPRPHRGSTGAAREGEGAVMAWSTRELAELAGTTLRAVRHYHEVGLLAEP